MVRTATALLLRLFTAEVGSETVDVRDRGTVDLKTFECRDIKRSSLIQRVCYDKAQSHMIISIKGVYDQYCELPDADVRRFDGRTIDGAVFQSEYQGIWRGWSVSMPDASKFESSVDEMPR